MVGKIKTYSFNLSRRRRSISQKLILSYLLLEELAGLLLLSRSWKYGTLIKLLILKEKLKFLEMKEMEHRKSTRRETKKMRNLILVVNKKILTLMNWLMN